MNDRYDIWSLDPQGNDAPVCLTRNGRAEGIRYTWVDLDPETEAVSLTGAQVLTGFHEARKTTAVYRTVLGGSKAPQQVLGGARYRKRLRLTDCSIPVNVSTFIRMSGAQT